MKLTISVVIPTYNEERDIAACLDSLMRQTVKPDEIILVNNNSTDATVSIASEYPSVKIINEKQKGITFSRTAGFNAAKSDIIARIDADTIASPGWIAAIKAAFDSDKMLCGAAGRVAIRELSPKGHFWFSPIAYMLRKIGDFHVGSAPIMSGHNMAIRHVVWDKIANYVHLDDHQVNEDVDLSLFTLKVGKVEYIQDMLAKTRMVELFFNIPKIMRYVRTDESTVELHAKMDPKISFQYEPTE